MAPKLLQIKHKIRSSSRRLKHLYWQSLQLLNLEKKNQLPKDFNHNNYKNTYPDLSRHSDEALEDHWLMHGRFEGRRYDIPLRSDVILKYINKSSRGLEIAPWFRPLAPKNHGFNSLVLDIFNRETLIRLAIEDPNIPNNTIDDIEDVDFTGSASQLWELLSPSMGANALDYIVSSHNFEHIPNPVKFLQDCSKLLSPSGVLSMAIPDLRCCFDYFRWPTTLTHALESYHEDKQKPNPFDVFDSQYLETNNFGRIDYPRKDIKISRELRDAYSQLQSSLSSDSDVYTDAHCQTFTPSSFQLLIWELRHLKLLDLEVFDISETIGNEFIVHLKPAKSDYPSGDKFTTSRQQLLANTIKEIGQKQ
jgi:SAM-dependent methyltransferase